MKTSLQHPSASNSRKILVILALLLFIVALSLVITQSFTKNTTSEQTRITPPSNTTSPTEFSNGNQQAIPVNETPVLTGPEPAIVPPKKPAIEPPNRAEIEQKLREQFENQVQVQTPQNSEDGT